MDSSYLSETLRKVREGNGLTKSSAANAAGIAVNTLSRIESDASSISMGYILKYIDSLGLRMVLSTTGDEITFRKVYRQAFYSQLAALHEGIDRRTVATMLETSWQNVIRIETHRNTYPKWSLFLRYLQAFGYEYKLENK